MFRRRLASLEFVRDLVTAVPTSANVKYYAQIVKDNSMRRKLIKLNEEIENECYVGKESVETVMDITEKKVFDLLPPAAEAATTCRSGRLL